MRRWRAGLLQMANIVGVSFLWTYARRSSRCRMDVLKDPVADDLQHLR
jgi:hypothetical protein